MRYQNAASAKNEDISRISLTADPTSDLFHAMCSTVDTPRSLGLSLRYKYREYTQLINSDFKSLDYEPVYHRDEFAKDYMCQSLLSKFPDFDTGIDRTEVAFTKWLSSESSCKRVNELFRDRWSGMQGKSLLPHHVEEVLYLAKRKMRSLLKSVDIDYIREHCDFGPGADLSTRGDNTSRYNKFGSDGSCTPWVVALYDDIFSNEDSDFRGEFVHRANFVPTSRLSFVPKNAKTDRAICVEPRWNVYLQLGIGALLQKRLLRAGIDIRSQERNQRTAQRAYVDGLATVDLSAASDCISKNLVIELFSEAADPLWLDLLLKARCPSTVYRGKTYRLEKISSMGNGYTFPLETLIFYCFAYASMQYSGESERIREDLCVYGDDIIVPKKSAAILMEALECFGFAPNRAKTFVEGNFYESCGTDYYRGRNVRPIFVKKTVRTVADGFTLANQLAVLAQTVAGVPGFASRKIWNLRELVIKRIPRSLRLFGPPEAGNGVIHSAFDVCRPSIARWGWEGYELRAYVAKPTKKLGFSYQGHLYSKLSTDMDCRNNVTRRKDISYRRKVVYVPTYTDIMLI